MICDILFPITPGKISMNTTASSNNSSDSSFEKPKVPSLIPRLQLSQDEKFEASLHSFEFKLIVPEQDALCHLQQLSTELVEDKYLLRACMNPTLEIIEHCILNDNRTTLMLKNIPRFMSPQDLKFLLNKDFKGQYDFIYLPYDIQVLIQNNQQVSNNLGYAFVNFTNNHAVLKFYTQYNNRRWNQNDKFQQICQLKYAKLQGKRDLMNQME
ncbi:hypothetical protein pb186bvf_012066 [Paramecium bursaria]